MEKTLELPLIIFCETALSLTDDIDIEPSLYVHAN